MNSTTNKQQSMLKCSNCLSVPLIQSHLSIRILLIFNMNVSVGKEILL